MYYETELLDQLDSSIPIEYDLVSEPITDNIDDFNDLFVSIVGKDIVRLLKVQENYQTLGHRIVSNSSMKEFIEKLYTYNCPKILKHVKVTQECYLLYVVSNLFYNFNENHLKLSKNDFIINIYFPNILNICSRYLPNARRFFQRVVKNAFKELQDNAKHIVDFYNELHHVDNNVICNHIIYLFLIGLLSKGNPITIPKLEEFYFSLFKRMFFFYLKSKTSGLTKSEISPNNLFDDVHINSQTDRYYLYEEAIKLSHIQNMCTDSDTLFRITKYLNEANTSIIPNELQKLYLFAINNGQFIVDDQKIIAVNSYINSDKMNYIKSKMPNIYRLLRSIHISSDIPTFSSSEIILIRQTIYDTLIDKFKPMLTAMEIEPIINKLAENVTTSLTVGEFIDMNTLTRISISSHKFCDQLKEFLELVLSGFGTDKYDQRILG